MPDTTLPDGEEPIEILLVEDNPGDVRLTEEAFETADRETVLETVTDGDAAVDRLFRRAGGDDGSVPDFVLLDLNLPGRDGCEVLEAIRGDDRLESLPVLILTSSTASEDVERCYGANANAYLTKPDRHDDFVSLVSAIERFWFGQAKLPSAKQ